MSQMWIKTLLISLSLGSGASVCNSMDLMQEVSVVNPSMSERDRIILSGSDYLDAAIKSIENTKEHFEKESFSVSAAAIQQKERELQDLRALKEQPKDYLDDLVKKIYDIIPPFCGDHEIKSLDIDLLFSLHKLGADYPKALAYAQVLFPADYEWRRKEYSFQFVWEKGGKQFSDMVILKEFLKFFGNIWSQYTPENFDSLVKYASLWFVETDHMYSRLFILENFLEIRLPARKILAAFAAPIINSGIEIHHTHRLLNIQQILKLPSAENETTSYLLGLFIKTNAMYYVDSLSFSCDISTLISAVSELMGEIPQDGRVECLDRLKDYINSTMAPREAFGMANYISDMRFYANYGRMPCSIERFFWKALFH